MSQADKSAYFQALKAAGVEFTKHYREYTEQELGEAYQRLQQAQQAEEAARPPAPPAPLIDVSVPEEEAPAGFFGLGEPEPAPVPEQTTTPTPAPAVQVRERDPNEVAGARLNTKEEWEPIRTDEHGRVWYQEEVLKPAFPKPRGRRVLQYTDTGTKRQTVKAGEFTETFEVAGDSRVASEVKITLPSYQVGIYKDPRFPFRVHVYNGKQGFDLFEVQNFYGGSELVPADIKRMYVENVLCYDVRTTIRSIQTEHRQNQLMRKA